ncbi:MAG: hypothetical protein CVV41_22285 [Candidatus Riflebacteria bacterium HGW-Riflebacteria-1]|nr:MAG: hypothetical protein CVV41_22285 [Candidatus Riflebacteria bacterium HGW-Riflebacteria-1]
MTAIKTRIWKEESIGGNEFAPERSFLYGQNFYSDLAEKQSYPALTFLHLNGRLPTSHQEKWLGFLLNLSANPGIRDEASLVAMNTAIGSPPSVNSVLAGLMARSGLNRGAQWIEKVMENLVLAENGSASLASLQPHNGLGRHYDDSDRRAKSAMPWLKANSCWGKHCELLESHATQETEILLEGLIAAGLLDLGFSPAAGAVLFLLAAGPALAAYALEQQAFGYKNFPHYFAPGHYSHSGTCSEKEIETEAE